MEGCCTAYGCADISSHSQDISIEIRHGFFGAQLGELRAQLLDLCKRISRIGTKAIS